MMDKAARTRLRNLRLKLADGTKLTAMELKHLKRLEAKEASNAPGNPKPRSEK